MNLHHNESFYPVTGDIEIDRTLPQFPVVLDHISVFPIDHRSLFLTGGMRSSIFPRKVENVDVVELLTALDGSVTLTQMEDQYPCEAKRVFKELIWAFSRLGILEDACYIKAENCVDHEMLSFLGKVRDQTRVDRSAVESAERLSSKRIYVHGGTERVRDLLVQSLSDSCTVGHDINEIINQDLTVRSNVFIVAVLGRDFSDFQIQQMVELKIPVILISMTDTHLDVGPLILNKYNASAHCYRMELGNEFMDEYSGHYDLFISLVVQHVILLAARVVCATYVNSVIRYPLSENGMLLSSEKRAIPISYKITSTEPPRLLEIANVLRRQSRLTIPPKEWVGTKIHEMHYAPKNIALAGELPMVGSHCALIYSDLESVFGRIFVDAFRWAIKRVFGYYFDSDIQRRYCPTGGNLGSPECILTYVNIKKGIITAYHYEPGSDNFGYIADASILSEEGVRDSLSIHCLGNRDKTTRKYGEFGENVICLDAGVAKSFLLHLCKLQPSVHLSFTEDNHSSFIDQLVSDRSRCFKRMWSASVSSIDIPIIPKEILDIAEKGLRARHATRNFSQRPVDKDEVLAAIQKNIPKDCHTVKSVTPYILWNDGSCCALQHNSNVTGTAFTRQQILLKHDISQSQVISQHLLSRAPVKVFFLVDLDLLRETDLQEELYNIIQCLGEWVGGVWLHIQKQGLAGCPAGASVESELFDLLRLSSMSQLCAFAFVLGWPE